VTEAMIPAARRTVSGFRAANFARGCLAGVGLAVDVSGGVMAATSLRSAETGRDAESDQITRGAVRADVLAGPAGGLVERGANPVVLATGVQVGEELRARAMPAIAATVASSGGDGLPHFSVRAADERDGALRAGFGNDFVGPLLVGSDVRFVLVGGVGPGFPALQGR